GLLPAHGQRRRRPLRRALLQGLRPPRRRLARLALPPRARLRRDLVRQPPARPGRHLRGWGVAAEPARRLACPRARRGARRGLAAVVRSRDDARAFHVTAAGETPIGETVLAAA